MIQGEGEGVYRGEGREVGGGGRPVVEGSKGSYRGRVCSYSQL